MNKTFLDTFKPVAVRNIEKDGIDYINISSISKTKLGKILCSNHDKPFTTFLGIVPNIMTFTRAIVTPNYPTKFISEGRKPTKDEIRRIPKTRVKIPNYWALVTYAYAERIRQDEKLVSMLKENKLPFVSFSKTEEKDFFGIKISMSSPNTDMNKPLAIITKLSELIKEGKFDDEATALATTQELVTSAKANPNVDLLQDVQNIQIYKCDTQDDNPERVSETEQ